MKVTITARFVEFMVALVIALTLSLLLTISELQRCKRVIQQAQVHVDTIYRGTSLAAEFCEKQIKEAKCKSL